MQGLLHRTSKFLGRTKDQGGSWWGVGGSTKSNRKRASIGGIEAADDGEREYMPGNTRGTDAAQDGSDMRSLTVRGFLQTLINVTSGKEVMQPKDCARVYLFRGLRVRMGLHSGTIL
jgi:hypothetical protein